MNRTSSTSKGPWTARPGVVNRVGMALSFIVGVLFAFSVEIVHGFVCSLTENPNTCGKRADWPYGDELVSSWQLLGPLTLLVIACGMFAMSDGSRLMTALAWCVFGAALLLITYVWATA